MVEKLWNPIVVIRKNDFRILYYSNNDNEINRIYSEYSDRQDILIMKFLDFLLKYKKQIDNTIGMKNWLLINKIIEENSEYNEEEIEDSPCIDCNPSERICEYCQDAGTSACDDCNPCDFCGWMS